MSKDRRQKTQLKILGVNKGNSKERLNIDEDNSDSAIRNYRIWLLCTAPHCGCGIPGGRGMGCFGSAPACLIELISADLDRTDFILVCF